MSQAPTVILFDFDFTLADPGRARSACLNAGLAALGAAPPPGQALQATVGLSLDEVLAHFVTGAGAAEQEAFRSAFVAEADKVMVDGTAPGMPSPPLAPASASSPLHRKQGKRGCRRYPTRSRLPTSANCHGFWTRSARRDATVATSNFMPPATYAFFQVFPDRRSDASVFAVLYHLVIGPVREFPLPRSYC